MFKKVLPFLALFFVAAAPSSLAQVSLFYLEAQAVAGYSSEEEEMIFYSLDQEEVMQKPSLGFDFVQRISRAGGDLAVLAVQARLAYNAGGEKRAELQLYNAYIRFKLPSFDLWVGHNRPALGLSSVFDTHSHLLPTLAMRGYGFDRDWGIGLSRDLRRGNISFSLTTGSGMPLELRGNYLFSGRISLGVLSQENKSIGFSIASGEILETMGYHRVSPSTISFLATGIDFTTVWNSFESRLEAAAGKRAARDFLHLFWRLGLNLSEEERWKLEVQPVVEFSRENSRFNFYAGLSFLATGELTLRTMYSYDHDLKDHRVVFQVYYYRRILF